MMEVPAVTCTRLTMHDGCQIFVRAQWFRASVSVTALEFPHSWSYTVTHQDAEEGASKWNINANEYLCSLRLHLGDQSATSIYSFYPHRPGYMLLSWTTFNTRKEVLKVALRLRKDSNTSELIPGFLNALMDRTLMFKDLEARTRAVKTKKTRQLAMRFLSAEKVKRRVDSRQSPAKEVVCRGSDGILIKPEFPKRTLKFNCSALSYEPSSSLSSPSEPPSMPALESGFFQTVGFRGSCHGPRMTPVMETPRSPVQVVQSPSPSRIPTFGMKSAERLLTEEESLPYRGHQSPNFHSATPNIVGNHAGISRGQLKPLPSGFHGISESNGEQALAEVHRVKSLEHGSETPRVPVTNDHDFISNKSGSSQMRSPVKVDVYDDFGGHLQPMHSQELTARFFERGLQWAPPQIPIKSTNGDTASVSRASPTFSDTAATNYLQKTPTCDKGVISIQSRKTSMEELAANNWTWGNPRLFVVEEARGFGPPGPKRRADSRAQDLIVLSDSEEEQCHNKHGVGGPVKDDTVLLDRDFQNAMEGLSEKLTSGYEKCPSHMNQGRQPSDKEGNNMTCKAKESLMNPSMHEKSFLNNGNGTKVKEEHNKLRLETEDAGWESRSRKRKARNDVTVDRDNENNGFGEARSTKLSGSRMEKQIHAPKSNLQSKTGLDTATENVSEEKPVNHLVGNRNEKPATTFNYESRGQWSTWIKEAKTEVTSWEASIGNREHTTGGPCQVEDQQRENVLNTSSLRQSTYFDTPPSLKKLERSFDLVDIPQAKFETMQPPRETRNDNATGSQGNTLTEQQEDFGGNLADNLPRGNHTREMVMNNDESVLEGSHTGRNKVERRKFIEVENDDDSDSVDEHVFETQNNSDDEGMPRDVQSVSLAQVIKSEHVNRSDFKRQTEEIGIQRLPGRRGRPPGTKSNLRSKLQDLAARPIGRPKNNISQAQAPATDYVLNESSIWVDENQECQRSVPDSDYYCFDDDRTTAKIKANQIWALYDDIDAMPRAWVRVKDVHTHGHTFEVKATWLGPHNPSKKALAWQEKTGYSISCGSFKEMEGGTTTLRVLNCFSHRMRFEQKTGTLVEIYPRVGEIWALHRGEASKQSDLEKDKRARNHEDDKSFRLVVILSECGNGQAPDIQVLRKRTGYRTLWEPGYQKGKLPIDCMEQFSHRVPCYKLTGKEYPDLNGMDCWDIDAAAVPACQSFVT